MTRATIIGLPLLIILVVTQSTLLPVIRLWDQIPQLLVLSAISWGMLRGFNEGFLWAFMAGFLLDLFSVTPIGINSLSTMAAVTIAIFITNTLPARRFWVPAVIGALCATLYLFLALALTFFSPFGSRAPFLPDIGLYFFVQFVFMLPVYWGLFLINRYFPSLEPPETVNR